MCGNRYRGCFKTLATNFKIHLIGSRQIKHYGSARYGFLAEFVYVLEIKIHNSALNK